VDDQLLDLYNGVTSEADVKARFITPRQTETNYIEFKEKADSRLPDLSESDKRNFSKALSSFSNAEGGILVWGIRTRRRDGRGYAAVIKPIKQVEAFAERLRDSLIDTLMPQNPGIRIEVIKNRLGNGYVKCYIPTSDNPPHRAMVDREYWIRLDGRSVRMEHYLIRDLMSRHGYPDLELDLAASNKDFPPGRMKLNFMLHNKGRAVAKNSGWFALFENAKIVSLGIGCTDDTAINDSRPSADWSTQPGSVIHANNIGRSAGWVQLEYIDTTWPITAQVVWYCEDMSRKSKSFTIQPELIR